MASKVFEFQVGEKTIGFRFNMLAMGRACRLEDCTLDQLFARMGINQSGTADLMAVTHYLYAAAMNYTEGKGLLVDYKAPDVADWIEEIGYDKTLKMIEAVLLTPETKNQEAPSETGLSDTKK
jgi:hypothetical protein